MARAALRRGALRTAALALALPWGAAHAARAGAQTPAEARPPADSIVAAVLQADSLGAWAADARFRGCPDEDAVGAAVLVGLEPARLSERAAGELADLWSPELRRCEDARLLAWYRSALARIHFDPVAFARVLGALPSPLPRTLRDDLLRLVHTPGTSPELTGTALDVLSHELSGVARLDFFLDEARSESAPDDWIRFEIQLLYQNLGTAYIERLAERASGVSDELLYDCTYPLVSDIRAGRLTPQSPGVATLARAIEGRPDLGLVHAWLTGGV